MKAGFVAIKKKIPFVRERVFRWAVVAKNCFVNIARSYDSVREAPNTNFT